MLVLALYCSGQRPSKWIHKKDVTFLADPQPSVADSITAHLINFIIIDKIIYLSQQLKVLNESVRVLQIATFHQSEAALIFNSGYDANIGLLSSVAQKGDTILYDFLSHASIRDGIKLSQAQSFAFLHNDVADLERRLQQSTGTHKRNAKS